MHQVPGKTRAAENSRNNHNAENAPKNAAAENAPNDAAAENAPNLGQLWLKAKLVANLQLPANRLQPLSPLFHQLTALFSSYKDVCWSERCHETGEQLR
jgi:hypothetical protein